MPSGSRTLKTFIFLGDASPAGTASSDRQERAALVRNFIPTPTLMASLTRVSCCKVLLFNDLGLKY